MKVEVDAVDAELLSALRKYKASSVMSWDVTLAPGVAMKVEVNHPLGHTLSPRIVSAVTDCIAASIAASKKIGNGFPCTGCYSVPCVCSQLDSGSSEGKSGG